MTEKWKFLLTGPSAQTAHPIIVATGVLTSNEYAALSDKVRQELDAGMANLVRRYGQEWVRAEGSRLREELSFFYGI